MNQEIKLIPVANLALWTENPRDPIDPKATDKDIIERALADTSSKWNVGKLSRGMGDDYDFSELPTVVYHQNKPVVYDGNRRMILAKLKLGLVKLPGAERLKIPEIPDRIPCNVCTEDVALRHILRKHSDTGSWSHLERDYFAHRFMGKPKSIFLVMEDSTGIVSSSTSMNQRFVKEEILTDEALKAMGFQVKGDQLLSVHNLREARSILADIVQKVEQKRINTRTNRRKVVSVLEPEIQKIIDRNQKKKLKPTALHLPGGPSKKALSRRSRRVVISELDLFGGALYLKPGDVSNLYRDIADLYRFYVDNRNSLSSYFTAIIRMSLRLLCEAAAQDRSKLMGDYLRSNFDAAKSKLSKDAKTTLANQNVKKETIEALLHTGAHSYKTAANVDQTLAVSLIVGGILTMTHGKQK